jgi:hypothetical protein
LFTLEDSADMVASSCFNRMGFSEEDACEAVAGVVWDEDRGGGGDDDEAVEV